MKKIYSYAMLLLASTFAFTSCSDDRDSNPVISQPTEFKINAPATASGNVDLKKSKTVQLTWSQPVFNNFNTPVIPTYTIQISPTGSFTQEFDDKLEDNTGADYISLPETFNACRADISTESIDRALMKVTGWDETQIPAQLALTVRVKAAIQDASFTEYMPVLSNTVILNTIPYYIELMAADPEIWWLIGGDIADGSWGGDIGKCMIPMNCIEDVEYDKKKGLGIIEWVGYLGGSGFKMRAFDTWDLQIGQGAAYGKFLKNDGGSGNIVVPEAGIYKITINTTKLAEVADKADCTEAVTIDKYEGTATVYDGMSISGSFNGWSDTDMTPCSAGANNHDWYTTLEVKSSDLDNDKKALEIKIKQKGTWDFNKGGTAIPYSEGLYIFGKDGGDNILLTETGKYTILFNDITGFIRFIKEKSE